MCSSIHINKINCHVGKRPKIKNKINLESGNENILHYYDSQFHIAAKQASQIRIPDDYHRPHCLSIFLFSFGRIINLGHKLAIS